MSRSRVVSSLSFVILFSIAGCASEYIGGTGWNTSDSGTSYSPVTGADQGFVTTPNRPSCNGQEATLLGTVYAPNGVDPVAGATVFVPSKVPELFVPQVRCEACGSLGASANFWTTTSRADGSFSLPLCPGRREIVIQNGRFRRFIKVDIVANEAKTLPASQTRLPRYNAEFDPLDAIPNIAVATGDFDKMECVLNKMGLDSQSVDLYEAATMFASPVSLEPFDSLIKDLERMKKYNIIFINCTGDTFEAELFDPKVRQNIHDYVRSGGRLYVTDWSYDWIEQIEAFSPFIDFEPGESSLTPEPINDATMGQGGIEVAGRINDSQMKEWLSQFPQTLVDGAVTIGHFAINWVMMHKPHNNDVKVWVEADVESWQGGVSGRRPLTVTFNFENCGKILFTSYHTRGREFDLGDGPFPQYCTNNWFPQERILEYLIFDIANCVKEPK